MRKFRNWRININKDAGALEAYNRFKKAAGLAPWEPPSDLQRYIFDQVFNNPEYDFDKFLELLPSGRKIVECLMQSRRA